MEAFRSIERKYLPPRGDIAKLFSICVFFFHIWSIPVFLYQVPGMILYMRPYRLKRIDQPILKYVKGDVLEIGCGTCRLSEPVEKRGAKYFGLDPAFSFLTYAQQRIGLKRLVCGQGEILPFQNASFDCIISGFYSYRYVNPDLGLSEARRILKKDGLFAFDLLNHWIIKLVQLKKIIEGDWKSFRYFDLKQPKGAFEFINFWELKSIEEPELEKRLGEEFIEYRKRTPMFFPSLRIICKKKV